MRDRLSTQARSFSQKNDSDTTPDVTTTRDASGRVAAVVDGSGTRTFGYTPAGLPLSETYSSGRVLTWNYDPAGRKAGYTLWENGAWQTWGGWGYSPASGRMSGVATREGWIAETEAAATGGGTLRTLALGTLSTRAQRDGLGRPRTNDTFVNNTTPSRLAARRYDYNGAGRLVTTREGDAAAEAFTERSRWLYGYNARGEVAAASAKWADGAVVAGEQFGTVGPGSVAAAEGYTYDAIGNRTNTLVNGRSATWGANELNQVTMRTGSSPNVLDVLGEADPAATVRVNGVAVPAASRHGANFFATATTGAVSTQPRWLAVTVLEEKNGALTSQPGSAYLPPRIESLTHDLDGNRTGDGHLNYTWDAENRLIAMQLYSSWDNTTVTGLPREKLVFQYDSEGRRTVKEYYTHPSAAAPWVLQRRTHFRYEGWNLIAESVETFAPAVAPLRLVRSYAWGEDLSGSLQGAGGVGGLVLLSTHDANGVVQSYWPALDNVGNVHALLNLLNGEVAAEYEYGPFGEPLRASGPGTLARENPFRFSTKYYDEETGLSYYGYRFYDPMKGRWMSRDPIGEEGGFNFYAIAVNNSTSRYDSFGLRDYKVGTADPTITPDIGAGTWNSKAATADTVALKGLILSNISGAWIAFPDAASHLLHYFQNTGGDYTIRLQKMVDDVPSAQRVFNDEMALAQQFVESFPNGAYWITSGSASGPDEGAYNSKSESKNWYYAVGGYHSWGKGNAISCNGEYEIQFEYKFNDRYNWDTGKQVTIAGQVITDKFMGKFHRQGLAREFDMRGSIKKTIKWKRGQAPVVTDGWNPPGGGR